MLGALFPVSRRMPPEGSDAHMINSHSSSSPCLREKVWDIVDLLLDCISTPELPKYAILLFSESCFPCRVYTAHLSANTTKTFHVFQTQQTLQTKIEPIAVEATDMREQEEREARVSERKRVLSSPDPITGRIYPGF